MGYSLAPLSDHADVFNGKTPAKSEQREVGNPILKIRDVDENGVFKGSFESFVEEDFYNRFAKKKIKQGDTLILNAAHNADYVGSKSFLAKSDVDGVIATGEWLTVRPNSTTLDASYAHFWLTSRQARKAIRELVKGIHLYPKDVARLEIPLPPLEEQKRIAAILDQADDIRRKRQHAIDRLNQLGQAIFYEMFGDPIRNPMAWDTSSLDSASTINPRNDTTLENSDDVTFLPMAAVSEQGKIISEEVRTYGSVKKGFTFFRKGDVLLAKITPCFENGKSAKTDDMKHSVGFGSTEFHVLRASESLHPSYLFSILHDKRFRNKAEENMTGSAGQKRVPSTYLKEYVIPLPPMGLQKEFASRIEAIDGLVAQNEDMLTIHEKLFTSLQHRAFAGEL